MRRKIIKILSVALLLFCIFSSGAYAKETLPSAFGRITYEAYPEVFSSAYEVGVNGLSKEELAKNKQEVYDYLISIDFNSAIACGIMANIECESSFNPNAWGDNGTSYGICQWHSSRFEDLKKYCSQEGLDYTTVHGQLRYLKAEMDGRLYNGATICKYLKNNVANTPEGAYEAGRYWCYYYEVPANREEVAQKRGAKAQNEYWPVYGGKELVTVIFMSDGQALLTKNVEAGKSLYFNKATKSGYNFMGWSLDPSAAKADYAGGKSYIINGSITLYAVWEKILPAACCVNFDSMGGKADTLSKTVLVGGKYGSLPIPVKQDLNFAGWYTDTGLLITEDSTVEIKTEHTLYARWTTGSANDIVKKVTVPQSIKLRYKGSEVITPKIEKGEGIVCGVTFASSVPNVVSVDQNGKVTGLKSGAATVTCTVTDQYGNSTIASARVTVKYSLIQWIIRILLFGWIWY